MAESNECISLLSTFLKVVGCTYMLEGKKCQNLCVTSFSHSRLPLRQLIFKINSEIVYVILVLRFFFPCLTWFWDLLPVMIGAVSVTDHSAEK